MAETDGFEFTLTAACAVGAVFVFELDLEDGACLATLGEDTLAGALFEGGAAFVLGAGFEADAGLLLLAAGLAAGLAAFLTTAFVFAGMASVALNVARLLFAFGSD